MDRSAFANYGDADLRCDEDWPAKYHAMNHQLNPTQLSKMEGLT
jgi:hypothetical protein